MLMKEWGSDPDEKSGRGLRLEAAALGGAVMATYAIIAYFLVTSFSKG